MIIKVAEQFSRVLSPRYREDGPYSGEQFREDVIEPNLACEGDLVIDLDGTTGVSSAFLDEAFGGLCRQYGNPEHFKRKIKIISNEDIALIDEISSYMI